MYRIILLWVVAVWLWPLPSEAAMPENFQVRNTQDLVNLCAVGADDPLHAAALHFCHGYLLGVYHYYQSLTAGPAFKPFICPPANPKPSRDATVQEFVKWAQAHPEYKDELPVDTLFRFLVDKWPCQRQ